MALPSSTKIRAYYNEIDPYAAQWLRNLISARLITDGEVDTRSIVDVRPADLRGFHRCHFFAGIGAWDYALDLAGWSHRQVWTGSCPCQPFSLAGKRGGFADERHLWPVWFDLIRQCRPEVVFGEQVASKDGLAWLDAVHSDLEGQAYAVGAADLCVAGVGAPHIRQRLWFVADARGHRRGQAGGGLSAAGRDGSVRDGGAGALADHPGERWDGCQLAGAAGAPAARGPEAGGRRAAGVREPAGCGATGGVGDAGCQSDQLVARGISGAQREGERRSNHGSGSAGATRLLGHAAEPGLQGLEDWGRALQAQRSAAERAGGDAGPGDPVSGFWADADWILCRDGKARPVEPGTFPLAHGLAGRVGRLRAYGNAINPEVAALFIEAFLDVRP
ncbi:DNA cytosine methyltransferase [Methylobacterium platani]|nr:DNA cytosine methyltransferase [Methylobacterium platani]